MPRLICPHRAHPVPLFDSLVSCSWHYTAVSYTVNQILMALADEPCHAVCRVVFPQVKALRNTRLCVEVASVVSHQFVRREESSNATCEFAAEFCLLFDAGEHHLPDNPCPHCIAYNHP